MAAPGVVSAAGAVTTKKKKSVKKASAAVASKATTTLAPTTTRKAAALATAGGAFEESKELLVNFTFSVNEGRARNPYVAVWLEDSAGSLVRTIDLSYEVGKGRRWLPDLKRWYRSDQTRVSAGGADVADTISGPTRMPGTYSATWDGRDENGALVKQGTYTVYVEAARERGPYGVVSDAFTVGTATFTKKLADSGELSQVSVQLKART